MRLKHPPTTKAICAGRNLRDHDLGDQAIVRRGTGFLRRPLAAVAPILAVMTVLLTGALATSPSAVAVTWLCKPDMTVNPCMSDETATIELGSGATSVEHAKPATSPPIDCFYVYPTVSTQQGPNANLNIDPEETQIAINQASRFSQVCNVYAPMYEQVTVSKLQETVATRTTLSPEEIAQAYSGVVSAWNEYMTKLNKGRGVVLIGHSQGAAMLIKLMKAEIDKNASTRGKLVSAVLLGANATVRSGTTSGGSFENIPAASPHGRLAASLPIQAL
jgi:hypothetical protein